MWTYNLKSFPYEQLESAVIGYFAARESCICKIITTSQNPKSSDEERKVR